MSESRFEKNGQGAVNPRKHISLWSLERMKGREGLPEQFQTVYDGRQKDHEPASK